MKKIAINALFCIPGKVGGSEIFLRQLLEKLSNLNEKKLHYYVFVNNENKNMFGIISEFFTIVHCPINASNRLLRILWEQIALPIQCMIFKIDLLHSPGYTSPLFTPCKKITTIFDLNYHFHPEDFNLLQLIVYKVLIPLVARTSNKIIVHSHNAKEEMVKVLKINPNKIIVIYPGVDEVFYKKLPLKEIDRLMSKYKITRPYIMSNAVSHPHKNLVTLILAYKNLVDKHNIKHNLVLLGFAGRDQARLDKIIQEQNLEGKIYFTGWIDSNMVPHFYQGAEVFVFPSLYEGFGLPSIEAMASGVPVVASYYSCIPEVVGKGGILVDSKNPSKITNAILKVLSNPGVRVDLIKRGEKRARRFRWENFAKSTYRSYLSLIE